MLIRPGRLLRRTLPACFCLVLMACGGTAPPVPSGVDRTQARSSSAGPGAGAADEPLQAATVRAPADAGPGPSASAAAPKAAAATITGASAFTPRRLTLPSGRTVQVLPAKTQDDGRLRIPDDPRTVGWWSGGSRPGDPYGTIVLAGHIDSRTYGIGALAELAVAAKGSRVTVSSGGRRVVYRVTAVTRVPKAQLVPGTDAFDGAGSPRLVLITCGGTYDAATHHYADNVVVTAVAVTG